MSVCVSFQAYTHRRLWSYRNQIWHTHADSPTKGSGKNINLPRVTPGGIWGVLGGGKLKNLEKLPNGWTNWHQIWHTCADSSGNGHRLKTISPSIPQGAFWGGFRGSQNAQVWKIYQMAVPIGTKFGKHLRIHLGMDIGSKQLAPRYPRGHFGGGF